MDRIMTANAVLA